jgi:glycosyltransferase involved in cell wall biosynthesis
VNAEGALSGKSILVISPQAWGTMFLSKHHYAVELARRGNKVFYLNPPIQDSGALEGNFQMDRSAQDDNLFIVSHKLFFPYALKFKSFMIFHFLMRLHLRNILKKMGGHFDVIWSFDIGNLYPLKFFGKDLIKVFHPVDEPMGAEALKAARGADFIFSVTREILDKYSFTDVPRVFINHGVAPYFVADVEQTQRSDGGKIRVGFSGNLLQNALDRDIFLRIINENNDIQFECWGSFRKGESNIGGVVDNDLREFIEEIQRAPNVILHGSVAPAELAPALRKMDVLLNFYDVQRDQSKGTNYHKIMEYLSTGKVIVSNNITTYKDRPKLVTMVTERDSNRSLPELFKTVISDLKHYNSPALQEERIEYAKNNTYSHQVERIEKVIYGKN